MKRYRVDDPRTVSGLSTRSHSFESSPLVFLSKYRLFGLLLRSTALVECQSELQQVVLIRATTMGPIFVFCFFYTAGPILRCEQLCSVANHPKH